MANTTNMKTTATDVWSGPLSISPSGREGLEDWAGPRRAEIDRLLLEHGALLFRGFHVDSAEAFRRVASVMSERLLDYVYRSTPRTSVGDHVYTATEYPASSSIPMHNENAYQRDWPMRLVFCCTQPAATGGETPLAWIRNVTRRIDPDVMRMFAERRVMYVRNYGSGVDLPWETVFQTTVREEVEAYCRSHDIEWEWLSGGRLRTRQVCQAVATHPVTGESLWFNQAHLFHVSALAPDDKDAMLEVFGEAGLPRNSYFGDGGALDERVLADIRCAYEQETHSFPWQRGDVLLLDNMLVGHSRTPFTGKRQVLVAMGTAFSSYQPHIQ
jgi:alpha-ketoglutarate-dependent taurine dioxygenase